MKKLTSVSLLFFFVAALESRADDKAANCVVKSNEAILFKIDKLRVTSANGGLRQGCWYQSPDMKFGFTPIVVDLQGGIMVTLYYNEKQDGNQGQQILLEHVRREGFVIENGFRKWTLQKSVEHPGESGSTITVYCTMTFPADRRIPANDPLLGPCPR